MIKLATRFRDCSIRCKIICIALATCAASLLTFSTLFLANDVLRTSQDVRNNNAVLAQMIGSNTASSVFSGDAKSAQETLEGLKRNPTILFAYIVTNGNEIFASYQRPGADLSRSNLHPTLNDGKICFEQYEIDKVIGKSSSSYSWNVDLDAAVPTVINGRQVSIVVIQSDVRELLERVKVSFVLFVLILFGAVIMAYLISARLQRIISEPVQHLASTMKQVTENHCYSLRAEYSSRDELGDLMNGFNEMLDEIELRDNLLSKQRDELEERVAERTAEVTRAMETAEAASLAKSQFLANMSHEIRTPMNGVLGMAELLLKSTRESKQRHYAETICKSAESLLCIINDILDFSKIEAGKLEFETNPFEVRQVVHDVVELFAQNAQRKGIEMACAVSSAVPAVVAGDMGRIRQILSNLVGNAAKFTQTGEIVVAVSLEDETDDGCRIRFEISDTGIGISPEACSQIFNRFSQADNSMTRQYGGTGLGLTIAKELTEMMGGGIGVSSAVGKGSTFWFSVPLKKQPLLDSLQGRTPTPLEGAHILVVDDNTTNLSILRQQLSSWGAEVETAGCGAEALALIESSPRPCPFEVTILDMMMPEMDGFELAHEIRSDSRCDSMQLLMLTSVGQWGDVERAHKEGIASYLTKPVRESLLYTMLANLLRPGDGTVAESRSAEAADLPLAGHVLLAEDNPVNQEVAMAMLQSFGCTVDLTQNGEEAVAAWQQNAYDLILMDGQMPVMDGYQATREIREKEEAAGDGRRITIVALTGHAQQEDRAKCLASGMDDYLSKPFNTRQLRAMVERWLPLQERAAAAPVEPGVPAAATAADAVGAAGAVGAVGAAGRPALISQQFLQSIKDLQVQGQPDLLDRVIGSYLRDSGTLLETMRQGLLAGDLESVQRAAHTHKSSSGAVGALTLSALCKELEKQCREKSQEAASRLMQQIDALSDEVRAELENIKQENANACST